MGWVELKHDQCNLPNQEQIKKVGAEEGSTWRCGDTGCNKTYVLASAYNFVELSTVQVVDGKRHPIQGLDYRDMQYAEMTQAEIVESKYQEKLREYEAREARAERRDASQCEKISELQEQIAYLKEQNSKRRWPWT